MVLRRRSPLLLLPLVLLALAGCGDEEVVSGPEPAVAEAEGSTPFVTRSEIRRLIEERVPVVWQALTGETLATGVEPEPVSAVRLAAQNGEEFVVLNFATVAEAEQAWDSVLDSEVVREGGAATRAANVVAVFPEEPGERGAARRVWRQMRALAVACEDEGDDAELRGICFSGEEEDPEAPGEGTEPEEVAEVGATVRLDGLAYTPQTSRQLNPAIEPDEAFLPERRPGQGRVWFGVALRVCNEAEAPRRTTGDLALVGAFGQEVAPVEPPAAAQVGYDPVTLGPGECLPATGSPAERLLDGALLLFEAPVELLADRPVALELRAGGERVRVALDV
jgi:hypothetical protein